MRDATPPSTTQYPDGMGASDDWAHQTSMQRATGSDNTMFDTPYAAQLGAQSEKSRLQSEAEPLISEGVKRLGDVAAGVLGALS